MYFLLQTQSPVIEREPTQKQSASQVRSKQLVLLLTQTYKLQMQYFRVCSIFQGRQITMQKNRAYWHKSSRQLYWASAFDHA